MRLQTRHTFNELMVRAEQALKSNKAIKIVEAHRFPNGAQKAAKMTGLSELSYPIWALAALKRDYLDSYDKLPEIVQFRKYRIASKGTAENQEF